MDEMSRKQIEGLLNRKYNLYVDLSGVLEAEQKAIIAMDVESLWAASSMKKKLGAGIVTLRIQLLAMLDEIGIDHGMTSGHFSLFRLLKILPLDPKGRAELEKIKIALNVVKEDVNRLARDNRRCIQEHLNVIDGVMTTITGAARQNQYGASGTVYSEPTGYAPSVSARLLNAEV